MSGDMLPTLVVIDIQREYTTPGRPFFLTGIGPSLSNARAVLAAARERGWSIIHVQHLQDGPIFNRDDGHADFVDGFQPRSGEKLIIKNKLSAFTNADFEQALGAPDRDVYVIGYGSTMCCMATIIDAGLFGRKFTLVHDASWARAPDSSFAEAEMHRHATAIIGIHGKLRTTEQTLQSLA